MSFGRDVCRYQDLTTDREWLVSNGLGSYASGSISGVLTRSYHGLLVAALEPPGERRLLLSHLDETVEQAGEIRMELSGNLWQGGVLAPDAGRWIELFELTAGTPRWLFSREDIQIERRIWMEHGVNVTYVRYGLLRAETAVDLHVRALVNQRSFHGGDRPGDLQVLPIESGVRVQRHEDDPATLELLCLPETRAVKATLECRATAIPYLGYELLRERERGLKASDEHLQALELRVRLEPGDHFTLRAQCLTPAVAPTAELSGAAAWQRRLKRQQSLLEQSLSRYPESDTGEPAWIRQLVLAADQFLVSRTPPRGGPATGPSISVIAGYHWFQDWGRDTLISLPGLTISTGRLDLARSLLIGFAAVFDRGMLPNRFPETGRPLAEADFNTVDAALWYFEALREYVEASHDRSLFEQLHDQLAEVLEHHIGGTRFNIAMDAADGLLSCGAPGVQLTWMDAIADGRVITPRRGKPVEINALWLNALVSMGSLCELVGRPSDRWQQLADRVRIGFRRFWNPDRGCCFDVIDAFAEQPDDRRSDDASVRPNQILAVSLPETALTQVQQQSVVGVCARELLTSHGLRSLSPVDPAYAGRYRGGPSERDRHYHQGTVWGWLLGPFALAHWRCHGDRSQALGFLEPMAHHLMDAGVGSISEVFDGDAPHAPGGCVAQAWSVAEVLRCWKQIARSRQDSG